MAVNIYRRIPIVVEVLRFTRMDHETLSLLQDFVGEYTSPRDRTPGFFSGAFVVDSKRHGRYILREGDVLVKDAEGDIKKYSPTGFEKRFDQQGLTNDSAGFGKRRSTLEKDLEDVLRYHHLGEAVDMEVDILTDVVVKLLKEFAEAADKENTPSANDVVYDLGM